MDTLLLDSEVTQSVPIEGIISSVEEAFEAYERGTVVMPTKSYIDLPQYNGDFRSMPAYVEADSWEGAAIKWVNVHPDNPLNNNLPTVMGIIIYSDPETLSPLAIMDATVLTRKRTAAAAAVATDRLAIENARSLGLIGAGTQSYAQFEALTQVRPIDKIVVNDVDEEAVDTFINTHPDFEIQSGTIQEAASCDIVSTVTPAEEPIVPLSAVSPHTHINAIGADAEGKQELDSSILSTGYVCIDSFDQAIHAGEINVPWNQGEIDEDDIDAELGELVRPEDDLTIPQDELTIFDSTGLAIQDVAAAHVAYEQAAGREDIPSTSLFA
ncbi:ornithine cyclodeaminase family protein [Halosimplex pelagicum]|uniref:Alanine dehydrogenase n=1 Tax=Halosimplex pelagicum TaxID=869886 RepID=A0A7D5PAR0_9EURY|nr:ornithine cyclodeaminase family protein [Halosimplex pelagicum]QLH84966.1 ornithine cyclodeaminase family protein [Halosimplex pelagicum]